MHATVDSFYPLAQGDTAAKNTSWMLNLLLLVVHYISGRLEFCQGFGTKLKSEYDLLSFISMPIKLVQQHEIYSLSPFSSEVT